MSTTDGRGTTKDESRDPTPLRVGIDVRTFVPTGGQARYMWRMGHWLADRGHAVHFLTVKSQPGGVETPSGVHLHRLDGLSRSALRRHVASLELDVFLINPERSRRYRGIHANVLRPACGTEQYVQKLASFRTPWGYATRRVLRWMPWVLIGKKWERAFYEDPIPPPEIVANSGHMAREVLKSYDVPEDHVHVIYNGVDVEEFSPEQRTRLRSSQRDEWGLPDDAVCLLFMGHNFRRKGLWPMLEIMARIHRLPDGPDVRLLVAGSGVGEGQRRKARRKIRRLGLVDAVHLLGPVRPAIRAFAAADLFLHLSWHDSFAFVVLEAMAAGLPVVTTPYTGASELMEDGVSGVVVDPGDRGALVSRVEQLLDPERRRAMGSAATAVAQRYSEDHNFRAVEDVMLTAARRAGGAVS